MKPMMVRWRISVSGIALLVACCAVPAFVLGQNDNRDKEEKPRQRAKQPPAAPKGAPQQQQKAAPADVPQRQPRPSQPDAVNSKARQNEPRSDRPNQPNANAPGRQANPAVVPRQSSQPDRGNNRPSVTSGGAPNNQPRGTFRPPVNASTTTRTDGGAVHRTPEGRQWETNRNGQVTHFSNANTDVRLRDNGRINVVRETRPDRSQVVVTRSLHGERTVEVIRPDRTRVVAYGPRVGFVERPVRTGYVSRTYVVSGRPVAYVYHTQIYRGVTFYHYVPPVYYAPVFYGWAWNPWARPVVYTWGWRTDAWYGYYGGYFAPAPVYPTAALWLTDFLLAENLRLAYEQRQAVPAADYYDPGSSQVTQDYNVSLSPEVKQAIAEEVRMQLAEMQNAANQPPANNALPAENDAAPPAALDPNQRIFVVSMNLDVASRGQDCALTPGDIILRSGDTLNGTKVGITVLNSKAGDCAVNSSAEIEAVDLQEMHNQFREKIDAGMTQLASDQGKDGIPASPAPAPRTVTAGTAAADANAAQLLREQQQEAAAIEDQARRNAINAN